MAALLESLLLEKVEICKARQWLKHIEDSDILSFGDPEVTVHRQEFVAFFLHFLREQSSQALTHGPATPAKTPSRRPAQSHGLSSERRGCRSTGGSTGVRSASRIQLFSPSPFVSPMGGGEWDAGQAESHSLNGFTALISPSLSSAWSPASRPSGSERRSAQRVSLGDYIVSPPELQPSPSLHRGRKKSSGMGGQGRHTVGRGSGHQNEDAVRMEGSGWRGGRVGGGHSKMNDQVSSPPAPSVGQLNFNNLEDFPPVGASHTSPPQQTSLSNRVPKPSRRINPTPVSAERPHSKPKSCFTSTPFSQPSSPPSGPEAMVGSLTVGSPLSLQEERELLKMEKNKRTLQTCSHIAASVEPCTPTKSGLRPDSKVTPDTQTTSPEPSKVTFAIELDLLAVLYCTCISENLVPNVFLELFFVIQLLTSRSPPTSEEDEDKSICLVKPDVLEKGYLGRVHNCVYFAVRVLENQFPLVAHLDKCTLRLLAENERVACFSPKLRDHLTLAQETSAAKRSPSVATFIHSVPFQPATDNRSNFSSDKAFHTFKKQRDIFYELLREWEDLHKEPAWDFATALGGRIRGMVSLLTAAGNHSHFARLFLKQLVQMCKGPCTTRSSSDAPDADLLGMLGADSLGRLKRLEERLIQPQGLTGPCPPPSFPGHQEFFRDFLLAASCCQLNQHLKDSLCQQLLQLDEVSILGPVQVAGDQGNQEADGDMEQQDEKQRFSSVLLLARLLAKFLGFISFLPYQTSERPSKELQQVALSLRSKSAPVLDVCGVLRSCVLRRRTVLTVPWLVEFLSMLDHTAPLLLCYRKALGMLLLLYRRMVLGTGGETCYLNQLLMVALLGWLFQIPVIPEDIFFTSDFTEVAELQESDTGTQGLDCLPLVDHQLLYTCCPFLGEFRKLLAAFVSGSTAKSGGIVRKITPTSAELKGTPPTSRSQQKLQVDLEQAFFHNQPPSLRRTVEFVAERVGSNCVKHMKATLVCELVQRGEKMLRDGLASSAFNAPKLNDSICAQLCDGGMQALERATRFCSEKGPEALRVLLPVETSPAVLATSESITRRLATEKACSWLSGNITALIKREWKSTFDRVMKTVPVPDQGEVDGLGLGLGVAISEHPTTPKRKQGNEVIASCPVGCTHSALMPSDVLVEIKEVLNIAVGPRAEEELITVPQLTVLLERVAATLDCRKFLTPVSEQMLVRATVLLACKLVSGEVPLVLSQDDGVACDSGSGVGPGPGVDSCLRALLEQLAGLWERSCCFPAPLHLLFTELTLSALLKTSGKEWNNFLFLVRRLVEKGLMGEDEMLSHWNRLSNLPLPMELMVKVQLQSGAANSPKLLPELPSHMDMLQVSPLPVEGTT